MICKKCNSTIPDGTKFCTNCGAEIDVVITSTPPQPIVQNEIPKENIQVQPINTNSNVNNAVVTPTITQTTNTQTTPNTKKSSMISIILTSLYKPNTVIKENDTTFKSFSNSAILLGIVSVSIMIINLLVTVITTLIGKSSQSCIMGYCTSIELSLSDKFATIQWWPLIWQYIVFPIIIVLAITAINYVVGLIFKKGINFSKLLSVTTICILPAFLISILVSPIISLLWNPASYILIITGLLYSNVLLAINYQNEFKCTNENEFGFISLTSIIILLTITYFVLSNMFFSGIQSLGSLLG